MAYESHLDTTKELESNKKAVAVKAKKVVVKESDSDESSDEDEEVNSFAQRLHKILKKQGKKFVNYKKHFYDYDAGKDYREKEKIKEKKELICYECKKPGHIKYECPVLLKKLENTRRNTNYCLLL